MEAKSMASGKANGTNPNEAYRSNSETIFQSRPFPTRSSMYFHRNCINRINTQMKKVIKKGPRKLLIINRCNRFILYLACFTNTKLKYFEELKRESVGWAGII
jgi:hypothetical protein